MKKVTLEDARLGWWAEHISAPDVSPFHDLESKKMIHSINYAKLSWSSSSSSSTLGGYCGLIVVVKRLAGRPGWAGATLAVVFCSATMR